MYLVLITFWLLFAAALLSRKQRPWLLARNKSEWTIDTVSLLMQGVVIPSCQYFLAVTVFPKLFPQLAGIWSLPFILALLLNLMIVDYVYYWNHRLLHRATLWPIHRLHHSARHTDVYMTSRNHLLSSFVIVYIWLNGLLGFFLAEPEAFFLGASITAALDLWRHSAAVPALGSRAHRFLQTFIITPHEHALHHSMIDRCRNFGANFSWWDRLHGTYVTGRLPEVGNEKIALRDLFFLGAQ